MTRYKVDSDRDRVRVQCRCSHRYSSHVNEGGQCVKCGPLRMCGRFQPSYGFVFSLLKEIRRDPDPSDQLLAEIDFVIKHVKDRE